MAMFSWGHLRLASAYAERSASGRYVIVEPDRELAARYGLNVADIQEVVQTAVGGMEVTESVQGRERYPINLRYPREYRDNLEELRQVRVATPTGAQVPLTQVADIRVESGPPMIKSENARLNGYVFIDLQDVDIGTYLARAKQAVAEQVEIPPGYSLSSTVLNMVVLPALYLRFGTAVREEREAGFA